MGFEVAPPMVRAPSIFAGIGTVLLAAAIARRWGLHAMLIATVLTGSSYVTINYSAEARGYSLAGFFLLAAFLALERYLDTNRWQPLLLFWMLVPLGFFSHLTFLHFYCGAVIWSVARWLRCGLYGRALLAKTAFCHAWPLLFLVTFYFVSLRGMEIGGGDRPSFPAVIVKALSLSVGGPIALSSDQLLIALLAAGGGIAALVLMYRDGSDLWAFFLTTIFLSPLFLLVEQPHSGLFVRYFFVNIVFNLLLITYLLGRTGAAGALGGVACLALVASIVAGNGQRLRQFAAGGRRGEYRAAVRYIVEHSTEPVIEVGVDHARTRLVLHAYVPPDRSLGDSEPAPAPTAKNEWYIAHSEEGGLQSVERIKDVTGKPFELATFSATPDYPASIGRSIIGSRRRSRQNKAAGRVCQHRPG